MNSVPKTREEAFEKFKQICNGDNTSSQSMLGIYDCRIAIGDDHYKAYEESLKAYLKSAGVKV